MDSRKVTGSRIRSPISVVAVDNLLIAGEEIHDFRNDDRPLIQKASSAGSPIFPCRDTSQMLAQGLAQGSIRAARATAVASFVSWCSEQDDTRLGARKDVAAVVEPTSPVAELVDDSTTVDEKPKLTPRHVGQCGIMSEL